MFFWRLNNEFSNIIHKVRSFCPIVFQWVFIRGWYFAEKCLKNGHFRVQIGGGRLLEHGHLLEILRYFKFAVNNLKFIITGFTRELSHISHIMRKPPFCICENKAADQLHSNRAADQRLFFATWNVQSLDLLPKSEISSI